MKTRRLATGQAKRGAWWASGASKEIRSQDVGLGGTVKSGVTLGIQRSIYDRALVIRFTVGFIILA